MKGQKNKRELHQQHAFMGKNIIRMRIAFWKKQLIISTMYCIFLGFFLFILQQTSLQGKEIIPDWVVYLTPFFSWLIMALELIYFIYLDSRLISATTTAINLI